MKTYTRDQIRKKFFNRYIDFDRTYDYSKGEYLYEVRKAYKDIHENTTLGQDVETEWEFSR